MDKYEYNIRAEQIMKLMKQRDYKTAAKIADGMDWRKVKNVNVLANVGTIYEQVGRYQDAKEILELAFDRAPIGRRLAYRLTEVCIASGDFEEAEEYYKEFLQIAPRDTGKYELQYKLAKKKGESIPRQIAILEKYKMHDFDACWAYELAKMYYKAGLKEKCIAECDELILWYGEGEYVDKALELKLLYGSLSPSQQEKYERRFGKGKITESTKNTVYLSENRKSDKKMTKKSASVHREKNPILSEKSFVLPENPVSVSEDMYNTINLQEVLAQSVETFLEEAGTAEQQDEQIHHEDQKLQGEEETENFQDAIDQVVSEVREIAKEKEEEQPVTEELSPKEAYHLTDEQRETFGKFLQMKGIEKQLCDIFQQISEWTEEKEQSQYGNIIVTGEHKAGKTTLAVNLIKSMNRMGGRQGRKIAKISGERMNHKQISDTMERLTGADLLIERAGEMNKKTVTGLLEAIVKDGRGMIVVLEDTPEEMDHLLNENPDLVSCFTFNIVLQECAMSEWVKTAKEYAKEQGYQIEDMATLALSAKIDTVRSIKNQVEEGDIMDIINVAIYKAEKKNIKRLFGNVFGKGNSSQGILREIDFE